VDGLLIGLEVAEGGLFRKVLVYQADDGVHLLAGEAVAAARQSAPHLVCIPPLGVLGRKEIIQSGVRRGTKEVSILV
jgi:hypothetical protein